MNHLRLALVLAALALAAPAFAGDLEDAQSLQKAQKFEEALPKFEAAAKADPANAAAALGLSQVLAGLGRYDDAARAVDAARKANPAHAGLLAAKGRAYLLRAIQEEGAEDPDPNLIEAMKADALRWAGEAMRADPKCVEALLLRGTIHQREGNDAQAEIFFEQAVAADAKSFDAAFELANLWFIRAWSEKKKELWAKAEYGFFSAMKLDPTSARAAVNHAHCKAWQGLPGKDVAAAYLQALALAPDDRAVLHKAFTYTPAPERVALLTKLAAERPKDVWRKIYLAYSLMGAKQHAKAYDVLEDASRLAPDDPYVPLNEGDVALDEGKDLDKAIDFYCEAISLFRGKGGVDESVYLRLAGPVAFEHRALTAEQRDKLWSHLWKAAPDRADAMNNAGLWYRDFGKDYKRSLDWYLRAAEVATDDACVQNDTGLIYHYHFKEFRKAEPYYRNAVRIGREKGYDWNAPKPPGMGYRDALNNLAAILIADERWADLKEFAENDVPEDHASRDAWLRRAEAKK